MKVTIISSFGILSLDVDMYPIAHNIEDAARSAASFEATDTDLRILMKEFKWVLRDRKVKANVGLCAAYEALSVVRLLSYGFEEYHADSFSRWQAP